MPRPKQPSTEPIPDVWRDETVTVPPGETRYWLLLTDEEVEVLSRGICPDRVSTSAFEMLSWKRRENRVTARALSVQKEDADV